MLELLGGLLILLSYYITQVGTDDLSNNLPVEIVEDAVLTTPGLIFKYGYPAETHNVTTQDGYILQLHRIPKQGRQPVLLQHGLLDSSAGFVLMGPEKGLAYILSQQGYDIWLGNSRGNRYSRSHLNISPEDDAFWRFTWHELGIYDLPATIDYILSETKFKKLHYIGHSQGTTSFFVMGSERPQYNQKVILMQALAPVAYLTHSKSPFRGILTGALNTISLASSTLRMFELLPSSRRIASLSQTACREDNRFQNYCSGILFALAGYDEQELNMTMLPVIYGHVPAGASVFQLIHYGQVMRSGQFQQYDYGHVINLFRYRSLQPPAYKLSSITTPIILHYAQNDFLSAPEDVEYLSKRLPHVIEKRLVEMKKFNHIDFIWGINVRQLLFDNIIDNMKKVGGQDSEK